MTVWRGTRIAGVDEAGRGPLAGPVVVAAVILNPDLPIEGLDDSKRLAPATRAILFDQIRERALAFAVVEVDHRDIDRLNILQATLWGMQLAVKALRPAARAALIDGNRAPDLPCPARALIQGDRLEAAISAASILAKVSRDRRMADYHAEFPDYGFDRHKGYCTPEHLQCLERHGPSPIHRRSFAPVRRLLQSDLF